MKRLMVAVLTLFVVSAPAAVDYGHMTVCDLVSVYDADTFRVNIHGWPDIIGRNISIRVLGVDAPEIRGKCASEKEQAQVARLYTLQALSNAGKIELRNLKRGKYFRILADVYVDGARLADELIRKGLARAYDGGRRDGWCG